MIARSLAWLNTLVPIIAVLGAYQIAMAQGLAEACMPLLEGCTSISRAARHGDALFWFRGLMMPMSVLFALYWWYQYRWLNRWVGARRRHGVILVLGLISALALILYANYLGSDGSFYRFMRRFGVTFYFAFAALAQLLSLHSLWRCTQVFSTRVQRLLRAQFCLVSAQWCVGLVSLWVSYTEPAFKDAAENIVEWNFALAMIAFYAFSSGLWRELPPPPLESSAPASA